MDRLKQEKTLHAFAVISFTTVIAYLCQQKFQTNQDTTKQIFENLNVTDKGNGSFLFFNRVSKVRFLKFNYDCS